MQYSSKATYFYTHMLRNLSVLRDIQRIIFDARHRKQKTIIFSDEAGERWMLKQISAEKDIQSAHRYSYS